MFRAWPWNSPQFPSEQQHLSAICPTERVSASAVVFLFLLFCLARLQRAASLPARSAAVQALEGKGGLQVAATFATAAGHHERQCCAFCWERQGPRRCHSATAVQVRRDGRQGSCERSWTTRFEPSEQPRRSAGQPLLSVSYNPLSLVGKLPLDFKRLFRTLPRVAELRTRRRQHGGKAWPASLLGISGAHIQDTVICCVVRRKNVGWPLRRAAI